MVYKECSCLPPELEDIIRKAVNNLKKIELKGSSKLVKEREEKLREPLEALAKLSSMLSPEAVKAMRDQIEATVPLSDTEKLYMDLERYIDSCKCHENTQIDWRKFPYGVMATPSTKKEGGRAFVKKIPSLPSDELERMQSRIKHVSNIIKSSIDDPVILVDLKNRLGEEGITWAATREELIKRNLLSRQEWDEAVKTNKQIMEAGGPDMLFRHANEFLNIRKAAQFTRGKFGKGK